MDTCYQHNINYPNRAHVDVEMRQPEDLPKNTPSNVRKKRRPKKRGLVKLQDELRISGFHNFTHVLPENDGMLTLRKRSCPKTVHSARKTAALCEKQTKIPQQIPIEDSTFALETLKANPMPVKILAGNILEKPVGELLPAKRCRGRPRKVPVTKPKNVKKFMQPPPMYDDIRMLRFREVYLSMPHKSIYNPSPAEIESQKENNVDSTTSTELLAKKQLRNRAVNVTNPISTRRPRSMPKHKLTTKCDEIKAQHFVAAKRTHRSMSLFVFMGSRCNSRRIHVNRNDTNRRRAMSIDSKQTIIYSGHRIKEHPKVDFNVKDNFIPSLAPKNGTTKFDDCFPHFVEQSTDDVLIQPLVCSTKTTESNIEKCDGFPTDGLNQKLTVKLETDHSMGTKLYEKRTNVKTDGFPIPGSMQKSTTRTPGLVCYTFEKDLKPPQSEAIDYTLLSVKRPTQRPIVPSRKPNILRKLPIHATLKTSIFSSQPMIGTSIFSQTHIRYPQNSTGLSYKSHVIQTQPSLEVPIFSPPLTYIPVEWPIRPALMIRSSGTCIKAKTPNSNTNDGSSQQSPSPIILDELTITLVPKRTNQMYQSTTFLPRTIISRVLSRQQVAPSISIIRDNNVVPKNHTPSYSVCLAQHLGTKTPFNSISARQSSRTIVFTNSVSKTNVNALATYNLRRDEDHIIRDIMAYLQNSVNCPCLHRVSPPSKIRTAPGAQTEDHFHDIMEVIEADWHSTPTNALRSYQPQTKDSLNVPFVPQRKMVFLSTTSSTTSNPNYSNRLPAPAQSPPMFASTKRREPPIVHCPEHNTNEYLERTANQTPTNSHIIFERGQDYSLQSLDDIPIEQLFVTDGSFNIDDYLF